MTRQHCIHVLLSYREQELFIYYCPLCENDYGSFGTKLPRLYLAQFCVGKYFN